MVNPYIKDPIIDLSSLARSIFPSPDLSSLVLYLRGNTMGVVYSPYQILNYRTCLLCTYLPIYCCVLLWGTRGSPFGNTFLRFGVPSGCRELWRSKMKYDKTPVFWRKRDRLFQERQVGSSFHSRQKPPKLLFSGEQLTDINVYTDIALTVVSVKSIMA